MNSSLFQLNKVRRLIKTQGRLFTFQRQGKNEFGEPNGTTESLTILGVYHETSSYQTKTSSEGSVMRTKPSPMIIATWEEAQVLNHNDMLAFNGKKYQIGDIRNIDQCNFVADISLEEIQGP